jgi:hypothetical protein
MALIDSFLSKTEQDQVKAALIAAGAPDLTFEGVLKETFKRVASKVAGDVGTSLMEKTSELISPIIDASIAAITEKTLGLID